MTNIYMQVFSKADLKLCEEIEKQEHLEISVIETSLDLKKKIEELYPKKFVFTYYSILNKNLIDLIKERENSYYKNSNNFIREHYLVLHHLFSRNLNHSELKIVDRDILLDEFYQFTSQLIHRFNLTACLLINEAHQVHDYILQKLIEKKDISLIIQKTSLKGLAVLRNTKKNIIIPNDSIFKLDEKKLKILNHFSERTGEKQIYDERTQKKLHNESNIIYKSIFLNGILLVWKEFKVFLLSKYQLLKNFKNKDFYYFNKLLDHPIKRITRRIFVTSSYAKAVKVSKNIYKNFIFVPLQCSPERQSMPAGMPYFSQLNLIKNILFFTQKNGLDIIVKEHPSQNKFFQKNYLGRSKSFYEFLEKEKSIKLISSNKDAYGFIDKSIAVAGIGGSICWESILRGVPTLIFGHPWYEGIKTKNSFFNSDLESMNLSNIGDFELIGSELEEHHTYLYNWLLNNLWEWDSESCEDSNSIKVLSKKIASLINSI